MQKNDIEDIVLLLNYVKDHNTIIRLKEREREKNKKIIEYSNKCRDILYKQKSIYEIDLKNKDEKIHELEEQIKMLKNKI